jgi:hypothetical protein
MQLSGRRPSRAAGATALTALILTVAGLTPTAAQADPSDTLGPTPAEVLSAIDLAVPQISHVGSVNVAPPAPPAVPAFPNIHLPETTTPVITVPPIVIPPIVIPPIVIPPIVIPNVSLMTSNILGAHVQAPLDPDQMVVLAPDDATTSPFHATVRDIEVDDPAAVLSVPTVEESMTGYPAIPPDPPTAAELTASPPSVASRTIGVTIPDSANGGHGIVAEPGLTVYPSTDDSTTQAVQSAADGAVRFLTVLDGPNAPTEFPYELALATGSIIDPQEDGSLVVFAPPASDGSRSPIARIAAPWAYDSQHHALPAWYTVNGHTVVLHVTHAGAAYPVVADPDMFFFHRFSPASPYAEGGSLNSSIGRFTSQVDYRNMSRLVLQWGFQLSYSQRNACSYHKASEVAHAAVFNRMTRYQDSHPNSGCDYTFHSSMSKYTYADDRVLPTTHYLRGGIGMPLDLIVIVQFQIGPRTIRQVQVYGDYIL